MNLYFVVRVKYLKDGTTKKSETMEYSSRQQAIAKFHTNIGTDMNDETLRGSMCVVLNSIGRQEERSYWGDIDEIVPDND